LNNQSNSLGLNGSACFGTGIGNGVSAFSSSSGALCFNHSSAFSPIQPTHSASITAAPSYSMQRQPSDFQNVRVHPWLLQI